MCEVYTFFVGLFGEQCYTLFYGKICDEKSCKTEAGKKRQAAYYPRRKTGRQDLAYESVFTKSLCISTLRAIRKWNACFGLTWIQKELSKGSGNSIDENTVRATLTVLAIGAGSMVVSHANDSYFWVVSNFGKMTLDKGYRTQTVITLIEGLCAMAGIFVLSLFLH